MVLFLLIWRVAEKAQGLPREVSCCGEEGTAPPTPAVAALQACLDPSQQGEPPLTSPCGFAAAWGAQRVRCRKLTSLL